MIELCEEMKKLRNKLDKLGIAWTDNSFIMPEDELEKMVSLGLKREFCDITMYRTYFIINDIEYSVINGYNSYGGYSPFLDRNLGLLEIMAETINNGNPCGNMTADDIINLIFKEGK